MATYSTNPNDWYFDVHTDEDGEMTMIGLSQEPGTLDDQLGGHNLPKEIGDLLSSVGVDTETELMESVF